MRKLLPGKLFLSLLALIFVFANSKAQITTFAGRHTYLGDNGVATSAGLFGPYAVARDAAGNLYIATCKDNRIRKVDALTHIITTIAGTGIAGFAGDGGPAINAKFNFNPIGMPGIAVDNAGNIYVGDYSNNRIRKIDAVTNIITTIGGTTTGGYSGDGGAATWAKLSGPAGIVTDAAGNVYFADNNNFRIRKIDAATKIITTIAGSGAAGYSGDGGAATGAAFSYPECLTMDKDGNIYISDKYNSCVRKITAATGLISTVVGNGTHGFADDGVKATSIPFGNTMGVAVDNDGNIYVADQSYSKIRKVDAVTGLISTYAGTGLASYAGDGGLATAAAINAPTTIVLDAAGNLYIDDMGNKVIRKVDALTQVISTVAGDGSDGFTGAPPDLKAQLLPQAVAVDAAGNTFIADGNYYDVRSTNIVYNSFIYAGKPDPDPAYASKGYYGNGGFANMAKYNTPVGVAIDGSNNVYIADVYNNQIRKVAYGTKFVTAFAGTSVAGSAGDGGLATAAQLNNPAGVAVDKAGNVYIADALNNKIRKVEIATLKISTIAGTGAAGDGGDGGAATSATLRQPTGMALDASGNLFILDRGNKRIRMVNTTTKNISTIFSNTHVLSGIATDASGNIFVSDSTSSTIIKLLAGTYSSSIVAGNGTPGYSGDGSYAVLAQLNYPGGLAVNNAGAIFVADINNNVVRKIIPQTFVATPITGNTISTSDSVTTCTGQINLSIINGSLPKGGTGSYTYTWLQSADSISYSPIENGTSQNFAAGAAIHSTVYYRRLVTSGVYSDSGNVIGFHVYTGPAPVINTTSLAICKGNTDTLATSEPYVKYLWSTGADSRMIINSAKGNFYVTVTDGNGCMGRSASVAVNVIGLPAKPEITSVPEATIGLCPGTTVKLTSTPSKKYNWSNKATTVSTTVNTAGTYSITVTGANGCSNTSAVKKISYVVCASPAAVTVATVTGTTASFTWAAVPCAAKYQIEYRVYGTTNWTVVTTRSSDTTYLLTGLLQSTKYSWGVASVCQVSTSTISGYRASTFNTTAARHLLGDEVLVTSDEAVAAGDKFDAMVYPNPAASAATLNLAGAKGKVLITITDMSGRELWRTESRDAKQIALPAEKLIAGVYLITLRDEKNKKVLKFIKK